MKVMVCIPCLMTGGTEIQTLSLVKALAAAGHEVVTVCYFECCAPMVEHYRKAGSRVVLLGDHRNAVYDALCGSSSDAVSKDRKDTLPDIASGGRPADIVCGRPADIASGGRPAGAAATAAFLFKGLRRVVRSFRPDVAHVQYMAPGAIPIVILHLLGIRKVVATAHTAGDIYPSLRLIHFLQSRLLTAFTCITERAERSFFGKSSLYGEETALAKKGNHFTIWNCLPDYIGLTSGRSAGTKQPASGQTSPEGVATRPLTLGVVSRLEEIKGMNLVIPVFAEVCAKMPETRLLVVGDGSQRKLMEGQAAEAGLKNCVEFAGRQPQERLADCYDRIDILLMPSRSEGFGLTAVEGMARGCVPVVADVGGLPEVVLDGETGLLHRPEDAEDIAAKILELAGDRGRMEGMSRAAVERAALFGFDRFTRLTADLYRKIERV